jgi:hypothetical protein
MKSDIQSFHEVLPLSSHQNPILPHVPTRIVGRPKLGALMLERLLISATGTSGRENDWIINDIEVDGVSQLKVKNLPGALFSTRGLAADGKHALSCLYFRGLDVIERESEAAVTVTYIGSNPHGAILFASIVGDTPPQRPTVLPITTTDALLPTIPTTITAILDQPLEINMLEIEDTDTDNGAADWVVNDIRIDGASQFMQSSDVPGDMFATDTIDSFIKFHPGTRIELIVTYIGPNESGCCFTGRFLGTVVRDDLQQPPPDVRAVIQTSGMLLAEEVIAHCDWRAPYVPSETEPSET